MASAGRYPLPYVGEHGSQHYLRAGSLSFVEVLAVTPVLAAVNLNHFAKRAAGVPSGWFSE